MISGKALLAAGILAIFGMILIIFPAFAQQPTPSDNQVNALAKEMYCPVCENTPLDVCPTQACAQWRELIRQKMEIGWSNQQIKDYFVAQYGDRVLSEPPARGLNWLIYILPPILILAGAIYLLRFMKKIKKPLSEPQARQAEPETPDAAYLHRMEDELNRYNKS
jgi:cytochrome c-type biogenesis protein CcmH